MVHMLFFECQTVCFQMMKGLNQHFVLNVRYCEPKHTPRAAAIIFVNWLNNIFSSFSQ